MSAWTLISPLLSGLIGAMIGASWGAWRDRVQRRVSFIEKQLTYLYAPLFALRAEIRALSQTREFFRDLGQQGWDEVTKATEGQDPAAKQRITKEQWPAYQRLLEFDDRKLVEVLLPAYRKMLSVFRDHVWLADFDTRDYYPQLIGFVFNLGTLLGRSIAARGR